MRALLLALLCSAALADPSPAPDRLSPEDLAVALCFDVEKENEQLRVQVLELMRADRERREAAIAAKYKIGKNDSIDKRDGKIDRQRRTQRSRP
jgi:hypothetical protein